MKLYDLPQEYKPLLDLKQTELAIKQIKETFQLNLSSTLRLRRVTAPLFVLKGTGLNDDLNGYENAVSFPIHDMGGAVAEVVHSLAKWKRVTLAEYNIPNGYGIYTDMNAIRSHEELDNLHSLYVDQWDWERVISKEERTSKFLRSIVNDIYSAILHTEFTLSECYPQLKATLPEKVEFIHSEELRRLYPELSPKEREEAITRKYGAVFIIGIGNELEDGKPHDNRAPDYDDYSTLNEEQFFGLNGDLMIWSDVLGKAVELSSMGIRVDQEALLHQQFPALTEAHVADIIRSGTSNLTDCLQRIVNILEALFLSIPGYAVQAEIAYIDQRPVAVDQFCVQCFYPGAGPG